MSIKKKQNIFVIHEPKSTKFNKKSAAFIPSISPLDEIVGTKNTKGRQLYLLSFRTWKRYKVPSSNVKHPGSIGHPWYNLWGYSQFDGTGFAIIQIERNNVRILKHKQYPTQGANKVDMRILKVPNHENTFLCTYNSFGKLNPLKYENNFSKLQNKFKSTCFYYSNGNKVYYNPSQKMLGTKKVSPNDITKYKSFESYCTFQHVAVLNIDKSLNPIFSKPKLVCANIHEKVEKNISMCIHKNRLYFQYTITPWVFLNPSCNKQTPTNSDFFKRVVEYYDSSNTGFFKRFIQFSCSTPLVSFNNTEYIAVGHFKLMYKDIENKAKGNMLSFVEKAKQIMNIERFDSKRYAHKLHYELIYGLFIYTVNKSNLQLSRTSGGIILTHTPNLLTFPTSIVLDNSANSDNSSYLIAYHENDITMKCWKLSKTELNKLLIFDNNTKPSDFTFKFL